MQSAMNVVRCKLVFHCLTKIALLHCLHKYARQNQKTMTNKHNA